MNPLEALGGGKHNLISRVPLQNHRQEMMTDMTSVVTLEIKKSQCLWDIFGIYGIYMGYIHQCFLMHVGDEEQGIKELEPKEFVK